MKIDLWTKVVFTVIAVCLAILAVRSLQAVPATATKEVMRVVVSPMKVDLVSISGKRIFLSDFIKK